MINHINPMCYTTSNSFLLYSRLANSTSPTVCWQHPSRCQSQLSDLTNNLPNLDKSSLPPSMHHPKNPDCLDPVPAWPIGLQSSLSTMMPIFLNTDSLTWPPLFFLPPLFPQFVKSLRFDSWSDQEIKQNYCYLQSTIKQKKRSRFNLSYECGWGFDE